MLIRIPKGWEIPEREITPEHVYLNRRSLLKAAGFLTVGGLLEAATGKTPYPAKRNPDFNPDIKITEEWASTGYNNFYEFNAENKQAVKEEVGTFVTSTWEVKVDGLVNMPKTIDVDEIAQSFALEERVYRHRGVEAWSMVVPWTGFPLAELIKRVDPKPGAKYVRFVTVNRPEQMPGIKRYNWYPWPYFEGLRMDEAMNPLCMVVTGLYGKPLPRQNGAPIRIVTPWKYGYKSPKSLARIEFVSRKPSTFWNQLQPLEYGFFSNVNPKKPHPRWSQATEKVIPNMERRETEMYNGYGKYVAEMYDGKEF
jgi:sulfoxide reductase catalytic subunit YedY